MAINYDTAFADLANQIAAGDKDPRHKFMVKACGAALDSACRAMIKDDCMVIVLCQIGNGVYAGTASALMQNFYDMVQFVINEKNLQDKRAANGRIHILSTKSSFYDAKTHGFENVNGPRKTGILIAGNAGRPFGGFVSLQTKIDNRFLNSRGKLKEASWKTQRARAKEFHARNASLLQKWSDSKIDNLRDVHIHVSQSFKTQEEAVLNDWFEWKLKTNTFKNVANTFMHAFNEARGKWGMTHYSPYRLPTDVGITPQQKMYATQQFPSDPLAYLRCCDEEQIQVYTQVWNLDRLDGDLIKFYFVAAPNLSNSLKNFQHVPPEAMGTMWRTAISDEITSAAHGATNFHHTAGSYTNTLST